VYSSMHYWYEETAEMLVRADPGRYSKKVALLIYKKGGAGG
jgi:hypothetical protein